MENTNINETQTTNATQTESGEKLFTQEQVNQIVSERLARERSKAATEQATTDREARRKGPYRRKHLQRYSGSVCRAG